MGELTIEESDEDRSIVTPEFRLRFRRLSDRWNHAIELRNGVGWQAFARSVEAEAEQKRPMPSPTYQELVIQREGNSIVALLVGSSGSHHYSATMRVSCTPDESQGVASASIRIDVADRCRSGANALASTYSVDPPAVSRRGAGSMPSWVVADQEGGDLFLSLGTACSVDENAPKPPSITILDETGCECQVRASAAIAPDTATQRLVYAWTVGRNPR